MKKIILKLVGIYLNSTARFFPKYNGERAFRILCKVNSPPLKPKTISFFETSKTIMLPTSRKEVALHSWGKGLKSILFLHGWQSNSKQWQPYVNQLDLNEYTIYALDAPAHGASEGNHLNMELYREALNTTVTHIGNVDTVICHSLGCLAMSYAYLYDPKITIQSYIIMGAPSGMPSIFIYLKELLSLSEHTMQNLRNKAHTIFKLSIEDVTLASFFKEITKPILVIHEMNDNVTPFQPIKEAIKRQSKIDTLFTEDQDHMLKGQETIDAVLKFIQYQNKKTNVY